MAENDKAAAKDGLKVARKNLADFNKANPAYSEDDKGYQTRNKAVLDAEKAVPWWKR